MEHLNTLIKVIFISVLFSFVIAKVELKAQQPQKVINLKGSWKFSIGDDKDWSKTKYNDSQWETIKVPSAWENQGFNGYDGYAWYRKSFFVKPSLVGKNLVLDLGRIDDVDEVYFNGNIIGASGSFPPKYSTAYNAWRKYSIPENIIQFGSENVISVKVYDAELDGGILEGDIGVYETENWNISLSGVWKFHASDNLIWKDPNYDDSKWEDIYAPSYWEYQGKEDYNGFAWYRKKFFVSSKLKGKKLVLIAGKIDDFDETFINGRKVGSTGPINNIPNKMDNRSEWLKERVYFIPDNVLKFGELNTIAIRVYDGYINGGIYEGPLTILTQENYTKYYRKTNSQPNSGFWKSFFENIFE